MNDTQNLPLATDAELTTQVVPTPRKPKQLSEAARRRRIERKFGPALFAEDLTWLNMAAAAGMYFVFAPLRKQIQQRARKYRRSPHEFQVSVDRLIKKRCNTDLRYRQQYEHLRVLLNRIARQLGESDAHEELVLSKHQRQRIGSLLDLMMDIKWSGLIKSGDWTQELFKALAALGKPGKDFSSESRQYIEIFKSGTIGYSEIVRKVKGVAAWEQADRATREEWRQDAAKAITYYRKSSSNQL